MRSVHPEQAQRSAHPESRVLPERRVLPESEPEWPLGRRRPESERRLARERPGSGSRSAQLQPEAVRCVPGAATALPFRRPRGLVSETWLALAAHLPRAGCPAAEPALRRVAGVYPRRCLPEVAVSETPLEPAARPLPERLMAEPMAWCPRAAVRQPAVAAPDAGQQRAARRSTQPEASAAPVAVLPPEEAVVRSARPEAEAAAASRASAAEVARRPAAEEALRAQAGVAAERAWAAELPQGAAVGAVRLWAAVGPAAAAEARASAAVARQPAAPDAGQQRAVRVSAWACHPDQGLPWPAPPPSERFARAMLVPRIAWP